MKRAGSSGIAFFVILCAMCYLERLPATAADCPEVLLLESTNGHDYVAVFDAKSTLRASFRVEAYARDAAYAFTVANVEIDKPTSLQSHPYRSWPTLFSNPGTEPLLGALVQPSVPSDGDCRDVHVQIPSVASVKSPTIPPSSAMAATQQEVRHEVAALPTIVVPDRLPNVPFACDKPFANATPLKLVTLNYPAVARDVGATGSTRVKISLDATGALTDATVLASSNNPALDAATVEAARKSTYRPGRFACKPEAGDYLFTTDFGVR